MLDEIRELAFGAWLGSALAFFLMLALGMKDGMRTALTFVFLCCGVQIGALLYDKMHGGDSNAKQE